MYTALRRRLPVYGSRNLSFKLIVVLYLMWIGALFTINQAAPWNHQGRRQMAPRDIIIPRHDKQVDKTGPQLISDSPRELSTSQPAPAIQRPASHVIREEGQAAPSVEHLVKVITDKVMNVFREHPLKERVGLIQAISDRGCSEYKRVASMDRLIIPDILAHAQYIPEEAAKVTWIAHMTEDRIPRLNRIIQNWNGPISISMYLNMDHTADAIRKILNIENIMKRQNVLLHIVPEQGVIYPVNYLRNAAINNTRTKFVFLTDIDFVPVGGTHNMLLEDLQFTVEGQKQVLVVPAFEENQSVNYVFPGDKIDLKDLWTRNIIVPFHLSKFPSGHHRTDFMKWRGARTLYRISWEPLFEPYIAGERNSLPLYSQNFVGRGMNKIQQVVETIAAGFVMYVHPQVFIVHIKHEKSRSATSQDKYASCSNQAMADFNKYIQNRYGFTGQ